MNKKRLARYLDKRFFQGIAHRGLHDDKICENGMKAFSAAIDNDFAFEFDIHLTLDGKLIVSHDASLLRMTGKEGKIEELTSDYIRENYRLLDGGVVPTLEEVLELNAEKVPMVIELKVENKNGKAVGKAAKEVLKQIKDPSKVMIISFFPNALVAVGRRFKRSLLVSRFYPKALYFKSLFESLDVDFEMLEDKRIRKYHKHHLVNAWTIENTDTLNKIYELSDQFTFQYIDTKIIKDRLFKKQEEIA